MNKSVIEMSQLIYTVPYGATILENINLNLCEGTFLGLLGHNGSGKTTLIDIILGNKKASAGAIHILEKDPHSPDRKNKNQIAYLSQDVTIKGDISIQNFLNFHSRFFPLYSREEEKYLLQLFDLTGDIKVGTLSTGQQKKVQIIAGLASNPKLIIIDEITAVLDPETRDLFFHELVKAKIKNNASIVLATNIAEDLVERADSVLFIEESTASLHDPKQILNLFNIGKVA